MISCVTEMVGSHRRATPLTFPHEFKPRLCVYYETQKQHVPNSVLRDLASVLHIKLSLMAFHDAGDGN